MIFGFKDDKTKEEVYSKEEVYTKEETYSANEIDALIGGVMVHGESSTGTTVNVGGYATLSATLSVPSGYIPVAILGIAPSTPNVCINEFHLNIPENKLYCRVRNSINEAVRNATVECWVLCLKEEFVRL